jgi:shikimate kinase
MGHLQEIGTVVYLKLPFQVLERRLHNIKGRGVALPKGQTLRELFEERAALYEAYADIIVDEDGLDVEGTIEKIVEQLKIAHDF